MDPPDYACRGTAQLIFRNEISEDHNQARKPNLAFASKQAPHAFDLLDGHVSSSLGLNSHDQGAFALSSEAGNRIVSPRKSRGDGVTGEYAMADVNTKVVARQPVAKHTSAEVGSSGTGNLSIARLSQKHNG